MEDTKKQWLGVGLIILAMVIVLAWMQTWGNKEPVKFIDCEEVWQQVQTGQTTVPGSDLCPGVNQLNP